jgi:hypothetical protein
MRLGCAALNVAAQRLPVVVGPAASFGRRTVDVS